MKKIILVLFLLGIIVSGCISNPFEQVPVVKAKVTFVEKNGYADAVNYSIIQGTVDYAARPMTTTAKSFPAITGRTMISKGKNSTLGPWEAVEYTGNGTYSFNIGFKKDVPPAFNDTIHVSIMVLDKDGKKIGYITENILWK